MILNSLKRTEQNCSLCVQESVRIDLIVSICQTLFKTVIAQITGSVSLGAASLVSLGDFFTKLIMLVSIKVARLPPSSTFPYGYGKIQFLSAMLIGLALMAGALALLIKNMWLVEEVGSIPPSLLGLIAVVISALASELLYRYLYCVGTQNKNSSILVAALDNRLDAISGIFVFFGIASSHLGWEDGDYWAAVLVSLMVIYVGSQIFYDALKSLLDLSIPEQTIDQLYKISRRTKGVIEVEYCRGRSLGETWELSIQIAVDQSLSTKKIQALNDELRASIKQFEPRFSFIQISNQMAEAMSMQDADIFDAFKDKSSQT